MGLPISRMYSIFSIEFTFFITFVLIFCAQTIHWRTHKVHCRSCHSWTCNQFVLFLHINIHNRKWFFCSFQCFRYILLFCLPSPGKTLQWITAGNWRSATSWCWTTTPWRQHKTSCVLSMGSICALWSSDDVLFSSCALEKMGRWESSTTPIEPHSNLMTNFKNKIDDNFVSSCRKSNAN